MAVLAAGYDRVSQIGRAGDVLVTGGLANCIAVVAHSKARGQAVMVHINTAGLFVHNTKGTGQMQLIKPREWMQKAKTLISDYVPPGNNFKVALGQSWLASTVPLDLRFKLVDAINHVFYVSPSAIGGTIRYTIATETMESQPDYHNSPWLAGNPEWAKEGQREFQWMTLAFNL